MAKDKKKKGRQAAKGGAQTTRGQAPQAQVATASAPLPLTLSVIGVRPPDQWELMIDDAGESPAQSPSGNMPCDGSSPLPTLTLSMTGLSESQAGVLMVAWGNAQGLSSISTGSMSGNPLVPRTDSGSQSGVSHATDNGARAPRTQASVIEVLDEEDPRGPCPSQGSSQGGNSQGDVVSTAGLAAQPAVNIHKQQVCSPTGVALPSSQSTSVVGSVNAPEKNSEEFTRLRAAHGRTECYLRDLHMNDDCVIAEEMLARDLAKLEDHRYAEKIAREERAPVNSNELLLASQKEADDQEVKAVALEHLVLSPLTLAVSKNKQHGGQLACKRLEVRLQCS
ncbi:hypothetical protein B0H10DRAFT_1962163 [Mycena sp. CBHHK59/15]|nr:hypothetical protein B0H10DRAFT_1962163 [Mycena sp. CBHHK59/15]